MVEEKLEVLLFSRLNSGYQLTPEGEVLFKSLTKVFHDLDATHTKMLSLNSERRLKRINVYTTIPLGVHYLPKVIVEFQQGYPDTEVNLVSFSEMPEIRTDHIDILISQFKPDYPNFQSIEVGQMTVLLYASPGYLEKEGHPKTIEDLKYHKFIDVRQAGKALYGADWYVQELEKHNIEVKFGTVVTNSLTSVQIAQADGGICLYSKEMVKDINLNIVPILSDYLSTKIPIYITIQKFMDSNSIVSSFVSLLIKRFSHLK